MYNCALLMTEIMTVIFVTIYWLKWRTKFSLLFWKMKRKSIRKNCPQLRCGPRQSLVFLWGHEKSINVPFTSPFLEVMSPLCPLTKPSMSLSCPPILLIVIKKREGNLLFNFTFLLVFPTKLSHFVRSYTKINHLGSKRFIVFHFYGLCMILFS